MVAREIQSLLSEKIQLEKEIQETDYNISVKNTEINSLQVKMVFIAPLRSALSQKKLKITKKNYKKITKEKLVFRKFSKNWLRKIKKQILIILYN
jgi:hypothetical protein